DAGDERRGDLSAAPVRRDPVQLVLRVQEAEPVPRAGEDRPGEHRDERAQRRGEDERREAPRPPRPSARRVCRGAAPRRARSRPTQPRLLVQVHEARVPAATGPKRTGPGAWHRDLSRKGYTDREPAALDHGPRLKQPCPGAWPVPGSGTWPERLGGLDAEAV